MSFGCNCQSEPMIGLGAISLGDLAPANPADSNKEIVRDVTIGAIAFASPIVYDKVAPRKWPRTKALWQDIGVVIGLYFLGMYVARKVI